MGQIATYLYNRLNESISLVFSHKTEKIEKLLQLLMDSYAYVVKHGDNANGLMEIIRDFEVSILDMEAEEKVNNIALDTKSYYKSIVDEANPEDLRYLFKYGKYITDNEIKTAKFLATYEDVNKIAYTMVKGYMDSFIREKKDYTIKSTVRLIYFVGQEAIVREVIKEFGKYNLTPVLAMVESTEANKQFTYDHRFDNALFFSKNFAEVKEEKFTATFERFKEGLGKYSGIAVIEAFGEVLLHLKVRIQL